MTAPLLQVAGLKVAYGGIEAERQVDLVLDPGQPFSGADLGRRARRRGHTCTNASNHGHLRSTGAFGHTI